MALCNEIFEQVTEDEIVFVPTKKTPILAKIISPLHKEMVEWCDKHQRNMEDFLEFAIQRELDFQNRVLRYIIKDLMKKQGMDSYYEQIEEMNNGSEK